MGSRLMMVLALVLLLGAGAVGYWGLMLSTPASQTPTQSVELASPMMTMAQSAEESALELSEAIKTDVIVLAQDLSAYTEITKEDLAVESLTIAPPGSFSDINQLLGRTVWRNLPAGTILNTTSFDVGGPVARMIKPGERALAIGVDEVVSVGGLVRPGDFVDVLLSLREDEKNSDRSAQVAVEALRVLSVGDRVGLDLHGNPAVAASAASTDSKRSDSKRLHSAVLAVPEQLVTRFLLASQVGHLQLAVRSAEEGMLSNFYAGDEMVIPSINQQLFQFEKFALKRAIRPQPGLVSDQAEGTEVIRGRQVFREIP